MWPASASFIRAIQVKVLEMEARRNRVLSGSTGVAGVMDEKPYPFFSTTWPFCTTATAAPAICWSAMLVRTTPSTKASRLAAGIGVPGDSRADAAGSGDWAAGEGATGGRTAGGACARPSPATPNAPAARAPTRANLGNTRIRTTSAPLIGRLTRWRKRRLEGQCAVVVLAAARARSGGAWKA